MRATWDGIQGGSYEFFAPVFAIWDYMVPSSPPPPLSSTSLPLEHSPHHPLHLAPRGNRP
jgi:hypothetical protein